MTEFIWVTIGIAAFVAWVSLLFQVSQPGTLFDRWCDR